MGVPALDQPSCTGTAKLNRGVNTRQTVGTESGDLLEDLQFVHDLSDAAELAVVESFLPGTIRSHAETSGPPSTGPRQLQWVPKPGTARVEIKTKGGQVVYGGPALVRRAHLRIVPTAAVLTVYVRLEAMLPDESPGLLRELGQLVDYTVDWLAADSPARQTDKNQASLPFDGVPCDPGDIVTFGPGGVEVGIVVSVGPTSAIVRATLLPDDENADPTVVQAADIVTATRICGPRGGPPDDVLRRLARTAPDTTPSDLLLALSAAQDSGGSELLGEAGWTLTSTVIATAAQMADPDAVLESTSSWPDSDDLPDPL